MWTKEEWEKECKEIKSNFPIKLKIYEAFYGLFAKTIFYDWYGKLYQWWNRKEFEREYKDIISDCADMAKDRNDAEMFQAWKENNPEEFKKWEESGKPDMFIY